MKHVCVPLLVLVGVEAQWSGKCVCSGCEPSEPLKGCVGEDLFVGCLTSQQHASVSQERICSDNFSCCHTEIKVADQTSSAQKLLSLVNSAVFVKNLVSPNPVQLPFRWPSSKASASCARDSGIASWSSYTSDFKSGTPVASHPDTWLYRVSASCWADASAMWLCETESLIWSFCLSVVSRKHCVLRAIPEIHLAWCSQYPHLPSLVWLTVGAPPQILQPPSSWFLAFRNMLFHSRPVHFFMLFFFFPPSFPLSASSSPSLYCSL